MGATEECPFVPRKRRDVNVLLLIKLRSISVQLGKHQMSKNRLVGYPVLREQSRSRRNFAKNSEAGVPSMYTL
jgi:hypothetical protein